MRKTNGFKCPICKTYLAPGEGCDVINGTCNPFSARTCPVCGALIGPAMYAGTCRSCKLDTRIKGNAPPAASGGASTRDRTSHKTNCAKNIIFLPFCQM